MTDTAQWRVSAIIPAYNRAGFLHETISGLLAQTVPPHEIIVVDDGSTDDTAAVVAGFGTAVRMRRIENSGAPVARNVGAAMATGDWLWFCDSDDLWRPDYLARIRAVADTPPHPHFLFGNFQLVRDGRWESPAKFDTAPDGFWENIASQKTADGRIFLEPLYPHLLKFQPVFHSTIVMTKALFTSIGGYNAKFARTASEDFEFTLRCVMDAPIGMIDRPLVGIRRHAGNYSANQLANLLGEVNILQYAKAHHRAATWFAAQIDAEIKRRNLEALELAFSNENYELVRTLAGEVGAGNLGFKPRLKVLLASLPKPLRAPLTSLAGRASSSIAPQGKSSP
jgi:glycosyltransferase involved in cell wall biosynthesis